MADSFDFTHPNIQNKSTPDTQNELVYLDSRRMWLLHRMLSEQTVFIFEPRYTTSKSVSTTVGAKETSNETNTSKTMDPPPLTKMSEKLCRKVCYLKTNFRFGLSVPKTPELISWY